MTSLLASLQQLMLATADSEDGGRAPSRGS